MSASTNTKPKGILKKPNLTANTNTDLVLAVSSTAASASPSSSCSSSSSSSEAKTRHQQQLEYGLRMNLKYQQFVTRIQQMLIDANSSSSSSSSPSSSSSASVSSLLKRASLVLRPSDYDAIIDERSHDHLCGFPLCSSSLPLSSSGSTNKQKYRLSLAQKRVYDASEGLKFCGDECMERSHEYRAGLQEEPIYLRKLQKEVKEGGGREGRQEEKEELELPEDKSVTRPSSAISSSRSPASIPSSSSSSTSASSSSSSASSSTTVSFSTIPSSSSASSSTAFLSSLDPLLRSQLPPEARNQIRQMEIKENETSVLITSAENAAEADTKESQKIEGYQSKFSSQKKAADKSSPTTSSPSSAAIAPAASSASSRKEKAMAASRDLDAAALEAGIKPGESAEAEEPAPAPKKAQAVPSSAKPALSKTKSDATSSSAKAAATSPSTSPSSLSPEVPAKVTELEPQPTVVPTASRPRVTFSDEATSSSASSSSPSSLSSSSPAPSSSFIPAPALPAVSPPLGLNPLSSSSKPARRLHASHPDAPDSYLVEEEEEEKEKGVGAEGNQSGMIMAEMLQRLPDSFVEATANMKPDQFREMDLDQQIDIIAHLALSEKAKQRPSSLPSSSVSSSSPPPSSSSSPSQSAPIAETSTTSSPGSAAVKRKYKKRSTEEPKASTEAVPASAPALSPAATTGEAKTSSASSAPSSPSSSSSAATATPIVSPDKASQSIANRASAGKASSSSSAPSLDLHSLTSDPIQSPSSVKAASAAAITALRSSFSPFAILLQTLIHWSTDATHSYCNLPRSAYEEYLIRYSSVDAHRARQESLVWQLRQSWSHSALVAWPELGRRVEKNLVELCCTFLLNESVPGFRMEQWRMMSLIVFKVICDRSVVLARQRKKSGGKTDASDEVVEFPAPNDPKLNAMLTSSGFTLQQLQVLADIVMNSH